jgi:hypothetical protein
MRGRNKCADERKKGKGCLMTGRKEFADEWSK